ncbi:hypothetical protein D3C84_306980 [compost metagenome]
MGLFAFGFGRKRGGVIEQSRRIKTQVKRTFDVSLLRQQHAFHVGMLNDRHRCSVRVLAVWHAALRTLAGVFQRVQIAGVTKHHRAHADADPRLVHHLEHVTQTMVRLAHQIADALAVIAEIQCGGGGAAPAHLVEQPGQQHVVALAEAAIVVDQELGHDEQRNALHPGRRVRQLGQHHVHDVFRQRMIATRDENLVALEAIGAVRRRFCAGTNIRQRRACVGFGQGHGAEEAAIDHRLQEAALLLFSAEALDQVRRAHGQERIRRRSRVGRLKVREAGLGQQRRKLHAASVETARGVEEAGFEEGIYRRFHFRNQNRLTVLVAWLVLVALAVVRGEELLGDVAGGANGGIEGFAVVLGETLTLGQALGIKDFIQLESQITGTEQRLGHGGLPFIGVDRV